jgi:hypothetical protein
VDDMKNLWVFLIFVFSLTACSNNQEKAFIGSWVTFDSYYGIMEVEFKKDRTMITKYYSSGKEYENEIKGHYTIIDNILFVTKEYENLDQAYNYFIKNDQLILEGQYNETSIYTRLRKTNRNISEIRKMLTGQWAIPKYNFDFRLIFSGDTVNIKEYDDNLNIIGEETYPYELTERYIVFKDIDWENNSIKRFYRMYMYGLYLYKINNDRLILKGFNPEDGLRKSVFLTKIFEK